MGTAIQDHREAWLMRDLGGDQPKVGGSWKAQGPQAPEHLRARASGWICMTDVLHKENKVSVTQCHG